VAENKVGEWSMLFATSQVKSFMTLMLLATKPNQRYLYLWKINPCGQKYNHSLSVSKLAKEFPNKSLQYSKPYEVYKHWLFTTTITEIQVMMLKSSLKDSKI